MANLPFERTRYNPVQDVTADEAERNKRQQAEQRAAIEDKAADKRAEDEDKAAPNPAEGDGGA